MAEERNRIRKLNFIKYLKSLGIEVHNNTKARGNAGFCLKNRIDISKNLSDEDAFRVLLHEFAHFVHYKLEPSLLKNGGSLGILFDTDNTKQIENELYELSLKIFDSRILSKIEGMKKEIKDKISEKKDLIKSFYPDFQISKKFREFDRYIRHSDAKYLLKYDRVIIKKFWFAKKKLIGITSLKKDFPDMPESFSAYLVLKSLERKRNRLNARSSKIKRYLKKPTELFARFIQSYYSDYEMTKLTAPVSLNLFEKLKEQNYYRYLNDKEFILLLNDNAQAEK